MTLTSLAYIAADLTALAVLVGVLYLHRHGRRDLVAAYVGINVGVLAVTLLLSTAGVAAGLGLGLFGVLSIIRLRSTEISQGEIAYFFAALALGLLGGIQTAPLALVAALMALVVASLWLGDHPRLASRNRHQVIMIDHAIAGEAELAAHLADLLGAEIRNLEVQRLDLVNDTTLVDVRYRLTRERPTRPGTQETGPATAPAALGARPAVDPTTAPAHVLASRSPATTAASRLPRAGTAPRARPAGPLSPIGALQH